MRDGVVIAIIYRQVSLFSTRTEASRATDTHWSGKFLSPQWQRCCHLSKWCYILMDPQPIEVTLGSQGSRLSDQWAPHTPDVFRGFRKRRISTIICGLPARTWWLLVVLQVTVSVPGPWDKGKSSSTSTGFKGFSQVSRITYGEQQQSIMCSRYTVWCNIKGFISYLAKINKQPKTFCSIHWRCLISIAAVLQQSLLYPGEDCHLQIINPGCVLMHQAADWKKKERKAHSCINMSLWKVPNKTGRWSTVPLAVSGNGNFALLFLKYKGNLHIVQNSQPWLWIYRPLKFGIAFEQLILILIRPYVFGFVCARERECEW